MSTKIIVSYDGTANEDDAIALGRVFARAGSDVALAYVRHSQEPDLDREKLAQNEAEELLARGAQLFGNADVAKHVVTDRSTPQGLSALAEREGASVIVFCSDSHTANGHVAIGNSAQQLLEGGPVAVAIAPVGLADREVNVQSIVAIGDADGGARATADSLAGALGAQVAPVANEEAGLRHQRSQRRNRDFANRRQRDLAPLKPRPDLARIETELAPERRDPWGHAVDGLSEIAETRQPIDHMIDNVARDHA